VSAVTTWTIAGVRAALAAKKISARELTAEFYSRIESRNAQLNAYLALAPERAYAQADRVDGLVARGEALPPLAGVPMAIKDVISTRGVRTTCASKILETYVPPYDATAVERLEKAGAVQRAAEKKEGEQMQKGGVEKKEGTTSGSEKVPAGSRRNRKAK